jgi:hypothetical protein
MRVVSCAILPSLLTRPVAVLTTQLFFTCLISAMNYAFRNSALQGHNIEVPAIMMYHMLINYVYRVKIFAHKLSVVLLLLIFNQTALTRCVLRHLVCEIRGRSPDSDIGRVSSLVRA